MGDRDAVATAVARNSHRVEVRDLGEGRGMASEELFSSDQDEESLRFLFSICHRDPASRAHGLETIRNTLDAWIDGYGSPRNAGGATPSSINGVETESLLRDHLPSLLRLTDQCPFDDVREGAQQILADLEVSE